jgi:hypothetical protein
LAYFCENAWWACERSSNQGWGDHSCCGAGAAATRVSPVRIVPIQRIRPPIDQPSL